MCPSLATDSPLDLQVKAAVSAQTIAAVNDCTALNRCCSGLSHCGLTVAAVADRSIALTAVLRLGSAAPPTLRSVVRTSMP